MSLKGKLAVVTGGSRSLGREYALRLAAAGADLILTYRAQAEAAAAVVAEIKSMGRTALAFQADLQGTEDLPRLVADIERTLAGRKLDILINNAGNERAKPFEMVTEDDLDSQYNMHVKSVFFLTQKLLPLVADGGRIINISSATTRAVVPPLVSYAICKSAVENLTRYLAQALGPRGITVNCVAPGAIDTDFNAVIFKTVPGMVDGIKADTAQGRVGQATDVVGIVAFLASDDSQWITGQRIEVSGGVRM